jgi:hypothetical protein
MSEAPERIWAEDISKAWLDDSGVWGVAREDHDVEYIRADIHDARIEVLEVQLQAAMVALNTCHGALHRMRVKH